MLVTIATKVYTHQSKSVKWCNTCCDNVPVYQDSRKII